VNGYTENVIPHLSKDYNIDSFDLIFIDHHKTVYLRDFKMLEEFGLIKSGTTIVADNVVYPGVPDYLEYVRNNPNYTSTFYEGKIEYREDLNDGIEISIRK
jgi:catechol O-methyltransferase